MDKHGFIYVWYDKKRKMYYVGCHWGTENDGYICSSNRMRDAYRRRPDDFKRRVVQRNVARVELLKEEHKWLSLIDAAELGNKYYNLSNRHFGHWSAGDNQLSIREKISKAKKGQVSWNKGIKWTRGPHTEETKRKIGDANKISLLGNKQTEESKRKRSIALKGKQSPMKNRQHSEETKAKMRIAQQSRRAKE